MENKQRNSGLEQAPRGERGRKASRQEYRRWRMEWEQNRARSAEWRRQEETRQLKPQDERVTVFEADGMQITAPRGGFLGHLAELKKHISRRRDVVQRLVLEAPVTASVQGLLRQEDSLLEQMRQLAVKETEAVVAVAMREQGRRNEWATAIVSEWPEE